MKKGEETKKRIISQVALYMNKNGYSSTSMSDIMKITGMPKGGIYNHFENKEDLTLQAFEYCVNTNNDFFKEAISKLETSYQQLSTVIAEFNHSQISGGCPMANVTLDAYLHSPLLLEKARASMLTTITYFADIIRKGIASKEIGVDIDPDTEATNIITVLEGGLILSKLFDDTSYLESAKTRLLNDIKKLFIEI